VLQFRQTSFAVSKPSTTQSAALKYRWSPQMVQQADLGYFIVMTWIWEKGEANSAYLYTDVESDCHTMQGSTLSTQKYLLAITYSVNTSKTERIVISSTFL